MELSRLIDLCNHYYPDNIDKFKEIPGLTVYCRDAPSNIEAYLYNPAMCLILQGSKVTSIGDQFVELRPGDVLIVSHDLPVVSRIIKASVEQPYLAVILSLDLGLVRSLYDQVVNAQVSDNHVRSLSAGHAERDLLAPLVRCLELVDRPLDTRVLGPSIIREIHYRLLLSPIGMMLRNLLVADSHASRIAEAIQLLRAQFRSPLKVSDIAKTVGMSPSSFHEHFRLVTGTTPLRYQKDLRLIEARMLLQEQSHTVSEAAYTVGYESPTQFSREYSRKFGLPPSRDAGAIIPIS